MQANWAGEAGSDGRRNRWAEGRERGVRVDARGPRAVRARCVAGPRGRRCKRPAGRGGVPAALVMLCEPPEWDHIVAC